MNQEQQYPQYLSNDDEINLWDLFEQVRSGWLWWVTGACLGLVSAIGYLFLVPPQYGYSGDSTGNNWGWWA